MNTFHDLRNLIENAYNGQGYTFVWEQDLLDDESSQQDLVRTFNQVKDGYNHETDEYEDPRTVEDMMHWLKYCIDEKNIRENGREIELDWRDLDEYMFDFEYLEDSPSVLNDSASFITPNVVPLAFSADMMTNDAEREAFANLMNIINNRQA
tara:strand:- start:1530 stop:1985 length:456 start_codon:yes stop_codon:yes gene_type:complete